jgi:hypothetical protein
MTNIESIRLQIMARLPVRVRWLVNGTPLDFDFSRSQAALRCITAGGIIGGTIEEEWRSLRMFGEDDYAEGGGAKTYLGVHIETGKVFGLDLERQSSQMFLLNSDVERFIQTFLALDQALRPGIPAQPQIAERLNEIDPGAFEHSEWRIFSDHIMR